TGCDRHAGTCSDVQPHHGTRPVFPPTIGQRERRFPKQTDQQQQEKRKTECAPVNVWPCSVKKSSRWNQRRANEINEIPRETFWRARQKLSIQNRSGDQQNTERHGRKMKTNDPRYVFSRRRVVAHVILRHPVFVAPNVTQQHQHEPCEVENEFFNRNRSAQRGYFPTECGRFIRENEKRVPKQQVERETQWR